MNRAWWAGFGTGLAVALAVACGVAVAVLGVDITREPEEVLRLAPPAPAPCVPPTWRHERPGAPVCGVST